MEEFVIVEVFAVLREAQLDDDEFFGGEDEYVLAFEAVGPIEVCGGCGIVTFCGISRGSGVQPELGAVLADGCGGCGCCAVFYPSFGEDALAIPHAIVEVEEAEASPVVGGGI